MAHTIPVCSYCTPNSKGQHEVHCPFAWTLSEGQARDGIQISRTKQAVEKFDEIAEGIFTERGSLWKALAKL